MTGLGTWSYSYDGENRLITAQSGTSGGSYGYDGNGLRVTKTVGTQTTTYVYDAMGNLAGEYGNPVTAPCTTCYVSVDQLGSTRVLTDAQGNVKERHDFMPFGDELLAGVDGRTSAEGYLSSGSTPGTSVLFTGQYRDTELANSQMPSGLDYFRGRHYAPAFGRFMQSDPVGNLVATTGAPQSWHLYSYGRNNPFAFIDPSGLCSQDSSGNFQDSDDGATFWFSGPCNSGLIGGSDPYTIIVDGGAPPPVPFDDCPLCMALLGPGFGVPASDGGNQPSSSGALQLSSAVNITNKGEVVGCLAKGALVGAAGAVVIGAAAALAAPVVGPAVVTGALFAGAAYGAYSLFTDISSNWSSGNTAGLAYDAGSILGGITGGYASGGTTARGITPGASSGWSFARDIANRWRPSLGLNPIPWLATGPDAGAAGGAQAVAAQGIPRKGC